MAPSELTIDRIPPTTASYIFATAIIAGVTGYFIGQGSSLGIFRSAQHVAEDSDLEDEDEGDEDGTAELATFEGNHDEVKLMLVVRTDLGMGKGTDRGVPSFSFSPVNPLNSFFCSIIKHT